MHQGLGEGGRRVGSRGSSFEGGGGLGVKGGDFWGGIGFLPKEFMHLLKKTNFLCF